MKKEHWYFIITTLLVIMTKINTVIAFIKNMGNMTWLSWDTVQTISQILLTLVLICFIWKFFQMGKKLETKYIEFETNNKEQEKIINNIKTSEETKSKDVLNRIKILQEDLQDEFTHLYLKSKREWHGRGTVGDVLNWDFNNNIQNPEIQKLYSDEEKIFLRTYKSKFKK